MVWIPSHQELRMHPKTIKAARLCGISIPQMIGHLHLLWWWAIDHAADGDLSRFDADDIALGAMWEGDADVFISALQKCGPGGTCGFLSDEKKLNDWEEYGGKYTARVESARNAAQARWDAAAMRPQSEGNAGRNAEKSREEKKEQEPASRKRADRAQRLPEGWTPEPEDALIKKLGVRPAYVQQEFERFVDYWVAQPGARGRKVSWQATWRNWLRRSVEISQGGKTQDPPRREVATFGTAEFEAQQEAERRRYAELTGVDPF